MGKFFTWNPVTREERKGLESLLLVVIVLEVDQAMAFSKGQGEVLPDPWAP